MIISHRLTEFYAIDKTYLEDSFTEYPFESCPLDGCRSKLPYIEVGLAVLMPNWLWDIPLVNWLWDVPLVSWLWDVPLVSWLCDVPLANWLCDVPLVN